jgi:transcriptional regulator with XRE-family HTH domain
MNNQVIENKIVSLKTKLATNLEEFRTKHNLTQDQMSKRCDILQGKYSKIKNGKFHGITVEFLIKLNLRVGTGFHLIDLKDY